MFEIIDAHHHFWEIGRFDYTWMDSPTMLPLRRNFLPENLSSILQRLNVNRTVFVQTISNIEENRWVLSLIDRHDFLAGMVGWVDLTSDMVEEQLDEFADHPKFSGVRHQTHDEPDGWLDRADVLRGLGVLARRFLPFDLLLFPKHLKHVPELARRFPELPMVINHMAKPSIKEGRFDDWEIGFREAARCENVYCKLSGMTTEADRVHWKPADLRPYIEIALEAFGPSRLMFGSDWPVCTLAGGYERALSALQTAVGSLSETEQAAIFGKTAKQFYNLVDFQ
jgi:L-fuconolactonase